VAARKLLRSLSAPLVEGFATPIGLREDRVASFIQSESEEVRLSRKFLKTTIFIGRAVEQCLVYKTMQEKAVNPVFKLRLRLTLFVINSLFHAADKRLVQILFRVDFSLHDFPLRSILVGTGRGRQGWNSTPGYAGNS
jgi:hypothetical protein